MNNFSERVNEALNFTQTLLREEIPDYKVFVSCSPFQKITDAKIIESNDIYFAKSIGLVINRPKNAEEVQVIVEQDSQLRLISWKHYKFHLSRLIPICIIIPGDLFNIHGAMYYVAKEKPTRSFLKQFINI